MFFVCIVFAIIAPYLICSINPAIIVTRLKNGKDIRALGSGGAGLTNTLRTQGKGAALVVLLFDVFKGVISILATWFLCYKTIGIAVELQEPFNLKLESISGYDEWAAGRAEVPFKFLFETQVCLWLASLSSVLGHCFPLYYKFKGGKAVLVTVATGLCINPIAALSALFIFIIIVAITRYVSLGSIIAAVCYPICVYLTTGGITGTVFTSIIAIILIFMHRKNIKRLINKNENKLGAKKNG